MAGQARRRRAVRLTAALALLLPGVAAGSSSPAVAAAGYERTWTSDADFDEGTANNVVHSTPDQLQLDDTTTPFGFVWLAVSSKDTIVKIDASTGQVLGEYRSVYSGGQGNPSRTTVDKNGSVWAGNRGVPDSSDGGRTVVHVGLEETGQCEDRNGNGVIDTSSGLGDVRPWTNAGGVDSDGGVETAADECILHSTVLQRSRTVRHVSVTPDNDVWVSGTQGRAFELLDGTTGAVKRSEGPVGAGGYGGLVDAQGVLWSARPHLRWDTSLPLSGPNGGNWRGLGHDSYGFCRGPDGSVWETQLSGGSIRRWAPDGTLLSTHTHGSQLAQGCAVDADGHVWVAHSLLGGQATVGHLRPDGAFVGNVPVGAGPTGVSVDGDGKVWSANYHSRNASRIDPDAGPLGADGVTRVGAVDLTTVDLGGQPYNYSDMTGSTLLGAPDAGTWSAVHDSGVTGAAWGTADWTADLPGDSALTVSLSTSHDGTTWSPAQTVSDGVPAALPGGRFVRVAVAFQRSSTGDSPVLYDLTVRPPNEAPQADAGGPYTVDEGSSVPLDATGSSDPEGDALVTTWDLDGDGSFDDASGAQPSFAGEDGPAVHPVTVQVCDPLGLCDTATTQVRVVNVAPTVDAGPDVTVYRNDPLTLSGTFTDPAGPADEPYTAQWSGSAPAAATYGTPVTRAVGTATEGVRTFELAVTDEDGATGTDTAQVTVLNRPPDCTTAAPSSSQLWPPRHQFVPVTVGGVTDPEGDRVSTTVTAIRQDEPTDTTGDGRFAPDGRVLSTGAAELRAERVGTPAVPGDGRVYHVSFSATDGHGGSCTGTVQVGVPHDQRGASAVDGGPLFDSTS